VTAFEECRTKDAQRVLDLAERGMTRTQICEEMPHKHQRYVYTVIDRHRYNSKAQRAVPAVPRRWSAEEDSIVLNGIATGKSAAELMAELPGRSLTTIGGRIEKHQHAGGQIIKHPRRPSSLEHETQLMVMWKAGELYRTIAICLQRSVQAIGARLIALQKKERE